ncbi:MAG: biosynthetic-type acetolactate synthase large subunit [Brevinematales bacterium]|jgi:acetolactate synthase-1/2/3 large subunit
MRTSGAQIIIEMLEKLGVEFIAGIPGGFNLPLYDALYRSPIRHILARHEQAAGFIAQGLARSTGKTGVCFATSGPGVTNLLTALADAKMDSIPIVAITGQVPLNFIGTDAFQEVDTYGITFSITKHNFLVRSADDLPEIISAAFRIASSGRPGPVLVDIPKDIQTGYAEWNGKLFRGHRESPPASDKEALEKAASMINNARKPLLLAGGGIVHSGADAALKELAHKSSIPVVSTLMGLGAFPSSDPLFKGLIGMHGSKSSNHISELADLVIACGTRFCDRTTGRASSFCSNAGIIHIDIDNSEFGKNRQADLTVNSDIKDFLSGLLPLIAISERALWIEETKTVLLKHPPDMPPADNPLHPGNIIMKTGSIVPEDAIITTDVGQHQMWVAKWYNFRRPRTLLTSGGLGTMGFGLPAAIGAALANPGKKVVCFTGDGSIMMNIQELATLSEYGLDITIIVMNNGNLGLVRQQQDLFYGKRFIASKFLKNTDFRAVGEAFGIKSFNLANETDPEKILYKAISEPGPCLVNVPVPETAFALPMVKPGAANLEMIG